MAPGKEVEVVRTRTVGETHGAGTRLPRGDHCPTAASGAAGGPLHDWVRALWRTLESLCEEAQLGWSWKWRNHFSSWNQLLMEPKSAARLGSICEQKHKQEPLPPPSFLRVPSGCHLGKLEDAFRAERQKLNDQHSHSVNCALERYITVPWTASDKGASLYPRGKQGREI